MRIQDPGLQYPWLPLCPSPPALLCPLNLPSGFRGQAQAQVRAFGPPLTWNNTRDTAPRGTQMDGNEDHGPGPGARSAMGWALRKRRSAGAGEEAHGQGRKECSVPVANYCHVTVTKQPEMQGPTAPVHDLVTSVQMG